MRAEMSTTGYVFSPDPEQPSTASYVTYVVQVDPKGALPTWVVNLAAVEQADNAGRMRERAEAGLRAGALLCKCELPPITAQGSPPVPAELRAAQRGWCDELLSLDLAVAARTRVQRTLGPFPQHAIVRLAFCCFGGDIEFCAEGVSLPTHQRRSCVAQGAVHIVHAVLPRDVMCSFTWDNAKCWFSSKQVWLRFELVQLQ